MSPLPTSAPTEAEFMAALGVEPIESEPHDGFWCYAFDNEQGLRLLLSFNTHEGSLQTTLELGGRTVATVVHEGVTRIWIEEDNESTSVRASFDQRDVATSLVVEVFPRLLVEWSSLRQ